MLSTAANGAAAPVSPITQLDVIFDESEEDESSTNKANEVEYTRRASEREGASWVPPAWQDPLKVGKANKQGRDFTINMEQGAKTRGLDLEDEVFEEMSMSQSVNDLDKNSVDYALVSPQGVLTPKRKKANNIQPDVENFQYQNSPPEPNNDNNYENLPAVGSVGCLDVAPDQPSGRRFHQHRKHPFRKLTSSSNSLGELNSNNLNNNHSNKAGVSGYVSDEFLNGAVLSSCQEEVTGWSRTQPPIRKAQNNIPGGYVLQGAVSGEVCSYNKAADEVKILDEKSVPCNNIAVPGNISSFDFYPEKPKAVKDAAGKDCLPFPIPVPNLAMLDTDGSEIQDGSVASLHEMASANTCMPSMKPPEEPMDRGYITQPPAPSQSNITQPPALNEGYITQPPMPGVRALPSGQNLAYVDHSQLQSTGNHDPGYVTQPPGSAFPQIENASGHVTQPPVAATPPCTKTTLSDPLADLRKLPPDVSTDRKLTYGATDGYVSLPEMMDLTAKTDAPTKDVKSDITTYIAHNDIMLDQSEIGPSDNIAGKFEGAKGEQEHVMIDRSDTGSARTAVDSSAAREANVPVGREDNLLQPGKEIPKRPASPGYVTLENLALSSGEAKDANNSNSNSGGYVPHPTSPGATAGIDNGYHGSELHGDATGLNVVNNNVPEYTPLGESTEGYPMAKSHESNAIPPCKTSEQVPNGDPRLVNNAGYVPYNDLIHSINDNYSSDVKTHCGAATKDASHTPMANGYISMDKLQSVG